MIRRTAPAAQAASGAARSPLRWRIIGAALAVAGSAIILACTATPAATPGAGVEGVQSAPTPAPGDWPRLVVRHRSYVCELTAESSVQCQAQMDIDTAAISQLPPVSIIATGQNHTCALGETGVVYCWGSNTHGQLGDPDERSEWRVTPQPVPGISEATFVGADGVGSCAIIRATTVRCWGLLGDGHLQESTNSAELVVLPGARSVHVGWEHACVLHEEGEVYCWGSNASNQLGFERDALSYSDVPVKVPGVSNAVYLVVGHHHACVLLRDRTVDCWGATQYGQLGDGGMSRGSATKVIGLDNVVRLEAGDGHNCAMREDRTVWCWGWNELGQLGDGTRISRDKPVHINSLTGITAIGSSDADVCVKHIDGEIVCWGENYDAVPTPVLS